MNFLCPHCKQPGISFIAKLYIGPKKPAICRECGKKAMVRDLFAILSLIPLFLGLIFALFLSPGMERTISICMGSMFYLFIYCKKVPLVAKD